MPICPTCKSVNIINSPYGTHYGCKDCCNKWLKEKK